MYVLALDNWEAAWYPVARDLCPPLRVGQEGKPDGDVTELCSFVLRGDPYLQRLLQGSLSVPGGVTGNTLDSESSI